MLGLTLQEADILVRNRNNWRIAIQELPAHRPVWVAKALSQVSQVTYLHSSEHNNLRMRQMF